jgi:hypothetical protein
MRVPMERAKVTFGTWGTTSARRMRVEFVPTEIRA